VARYAFTVRLLHSLHLAGFAGARTLVEALDDFN
jgi:hypothetical protein